MVNNFRTLPFMKIVVLMKNLKKSFIYYKIIYFLFGKLRNFTYIAHINKKKQYY